MKLFGLIGHPLKHSFSKQYFTEKFEKEGLADHHYELFDIPSLDLLPGLLKQYPNLVGLNVTIPYKEKVIAYLTDLDTSAEQTEAVNVIKIKEGRLIGYNSDAVGFEQSLFGFINPDQQHKALILGEGGAAKAVRFVLNKNEINFTTVSRRTDAPLQYHELDQETIQEHTLIINTTPLGTFPNIDQAPDIPYQFLTAQHFAFDLVYNPAETAFMNRAKQQGAQVKNGLEMLHLQAQKAWEIWNNE